MVMLSVPLTIVTCVMIAVMMMVSGNVLKLSGQNFVKQQKSIGELNGFVEEMLSGQKTIMAYAYENQVQDRFNSINNEVADSYYDAEYYGCSMYLWMAMAIRYQKCRQWMAFCQIVSL